MARRRTDLTLIDADGHEAIQVSQYDIIDLVIESEGGAYLSAAAVLHRLDIAAPFVVDPGPVVQEIGTLAQVTISDLIRDISYELVITFGYADGTTESGTISIDCVS